MVVFPHCKINLGLHVISRREDGYHNLETCFYPVPWTDILEIIPSSEFSFTHSGNFIPGNTQDNLCIKAYYSLKEKFGLPPVKIHLHKVIPTGAGLGGGSSDAAFTLRLLNTKFNLNLSHNQLREYASQLGSDCAFFIDDAPMLGESRGEQLSSLPISLKGYYLVLIKPDIHVSTVEAYAGVKPQKPIRSITQVLQQDIGTWKDLLVNHFEKSVFEKYPEIKKIKETLYEQGALYSSMSGSGSAVFGIFKNKIQIPQSLQQHSHWADYLN